MIKIFKKTGTEEKTEKFSAIEKLVNNELGLHEKMSSLRDSISVVKLTPNGESELIKLLFTGLSSKIYIPRKGDNSERFDAIIDFLDYKAVVEIEIPSSAILDAPRNLLDDYAVLKARKDEGDNIIIPLVICWDLPNKRTDYWNVVSDVKKILGIEIKTLSILALAVHYWTKTPLDLLDDSYYLDNNNSAMRGASKLLIPEGISMEDFPGYFTPFK